MSIQQALPCSLSPTIGGRYIYFVHVCSNNNKQIMPKLSEMKSIKNIALVKIPYNIRIAQNKQADVQRLN